MGERYKIAILVSHPIQYQTPLFQKLAQHPALDLVVYFCWDFGTKKTYDVEFGKEVKWDIPLLDGYRYKFLPNFSFKPSSGFWGQINPSIIKEIKIGKYDAILVFGWNSLTNWLAFLTAFYRGIPVLLRGENPLSQELLKPKWKIVIKKNILGWLFKRIASLLYIGVENKEFYQYYGVPEQKLFFCPYAVDNERFIGESQRIDRREAKKKLGIGGKKVVILFIGKLIDKKRPLDLLRAYQELQNDDKALLFVGDGTLRTGMEDYVNRHNLADVHFVGFKNQSDLPNYYAASDILVLPSGLGETWGIVVNEAMCFGLPIIVSDVAGCGPDLVRHGENGFIFPVGDLKQLIGLLGSLMRDPVLRERFSEKSLTIIKNYSYDKDLEAILTALNHLRRT